MMNSKFYSELQKRGFHNDRQTVLKTNTCVDLGLIVFIADKESNFADKF